MINRKQRQWLKDNKFWHCKLDCILGIEKLNY